MKKTTSLLALTTLAGKHTKPQLDSLAQHGHIARALDHLLARPACRWAALGLLAALAFGFRPAQAAVTEAWVHRYSNMASNSVDQAFKVVSDAAGNIIVAASTDDGNTGQDMLTIKYSGADGSVLWQKRYNGPGNGNDQAQAVAVDGSANVVVTGSSSGTNGYIDYYTAKYAAANGALLWEQRYNGSSYSSKGANGVALDGSGNVVVTGSSEGDYFTAKYAETDGALLWEKRSNGPANGDDRVGSGRSLALGSNGMVVVTGSSSGDYATVVYRENLPPVSIARVQTGIRLRFTGVPGSIHNIERAPVVNGPWSTVNTQTSSASGLLEYLDTPSPGQAFYRAAQP